MARDRDVAAFGGRAHGYDEGWRGRMHHRIADRTADLALACVPAPRRILDVGSGTGYLLGRVAARVPQAEVLAGIDADHRVHVPCRRRVPAHPHPARRHGRAHDHRGGQRGRAVVFPAPARAGSQVS